MRTSKRHEYNPDYAVAPGRLVQEYIDSALITQAELAKRLDLSVMSLNRILTGEQTVTRNTAEKLALVTKIDANTWIAMEEEYQERKQRIEQAEEARADLVWLKSMPLLQLIRMNRIKKCPDKTEQLREVLRFFQVGSVAAWRNIWSAPTVAARRSVCFQSNPQATACWLQLGINEARGAVCEKYDRRKFAAAVEQIRNLTTQTPKKFMPEMKRLCRESGVALVFVPEISGVHWNGATMWVSANKAMIIMNNRGRFEDRFWFSFFHEVAHILHDGKKGVYVWDEKVVDERETKADDFAAKILIPKRWDSEIESAANKWAIVELATRIGVSAAIVAGRYEHITGDYKTYCRLKRRFLAEEYLQ